MAAKKPPAQNFTVKLRKAAQSAARFFTRAYTGFKNTLNPERGPALRKVWYYAARCFGWVIKLGLTVVAIAACTGAVVVLYGTMYITNGIDAGAPILLSEYDPNLSTEFYAKTSADGPYVLVDTISAGENRIWATYDEIPQYLKDAIVAIEDRNFWAHDGVDWKRTIGAFGNMFLQMKGTFGGSTITQQLIKNTTERDEATVRRKFEEIFSALDLESLHSKEFILENYLNVIPLGNLCYGVRTAAEMYFGKELDELTLLECACLAGITNNPYLYDPFQNPKNNRRRTELILNEMFSQGLITEAEYTRAISQKLDFKSREQVQESNIRTWYVDEVIRDLQSDLMERNGWSNLQMATQMVYSGGLSVYMAQDLSIQKHMDSVWKNDENWPKASDAERQEGSMLIMDPHTGDIVAMIGSRAEKTGNFWSNMATMTVRQPGSSIKPISVYAPGFELGYITPYDAMLDAPVELNGKAYPLNLPQVYDGRVTIQYAVEHSKNRIAIRFMRDVLTPEASRKFMQERFHVTTLVNEVTAAGLIDGESSMALGGLTNGMTVKEMTAAWCVFPTGGTYSKPRTYTEVRDKDGELLIDNRPERSVSVSPLTAYYMTTVLQSTVTSGIATRAQLSNNMPTAGKTGTTNENKDRWFCGYTPYYVGVCWFGYKMPRDLGNIQPNPAMMLWKNVMEPVHEGLAVRGFDIPPGLVTAQYCMDSGMAADDGCRHDPRGSRVKTGTYGPADVPKQACTMHAAADRCNVTGKLARPDCPQATRSTVYLLRDPDRVMYGRNIEIMDEQYTFRRYGVFTYNIEDPETQYVPLQRDSFINTFCTYQHPAAQAPQPTTPPDGGDGDGGGDDAPPLPDVLPIGWINE